MVARDVEDHIVALPIPGEILLRVIDDVVGPKRSHHVDVPGAAHSRHVRSERSGNLHAEGADASRGTIDQDLLTGLHLTCISERLKRDATDHRYRRGLLKCHTPWLRREVVFSGADILGECTLAPAEYLVTRMPLAYVLANRFHGSRDIRTPDGRLWPAQPSEHHAEQVRHAAHHGTVGPVHASRMNA